MRAARKVIDALISGESSETAEEIRATASANEADAEELYGEAENAADACKDLAESAWEAAESACMTCGFFQCACRETMSAVLNRFGAPVVEAQAVALGYMHLSDDPEIVAQGQRTIAEGYDVPLFSLDIIEDIEDEPAPEFAEGDRVWHDVHGLGTVKAVAGDVEMSPVMSLSTVTVAAGELAPFVAEEREPVVRKLFGQELTAKGEKHQYVLRMPWGGAAWAVGPTADIVFARYKEFRTAPLRRFPPLVGPLPRIAGAGDHRTGARLRAGRAVGQRVPGAHRGQARRRGLRHLVRPGPHVRDHPGSRAQHRDPLPRVHRGHPVRRTPRAARGDTGPLRVVRARMGVGPGQVAEGTHPDRRSRDGRLPGRLPFLLRRDHPRGVPRGPAAERHRAGRVRRIRGMGRRDGGKQVKKQEQGESTVGRGSMAPKKSTAVRVGDIVFSDKSSFPCVAGLLGHRYVVRKLAGTFGATRAR